MKLPHVGLIRSIPWDQMEGRFLGSRVWGESERGELGHEPSWARGGEGVVRREREESDLNDVGPKTICSG